MIEITELKKTGYKAQLPVRTELEDPELQGKVDAILAAVHEEGDAALLRYSEEFDKVHLTDLEVPIERCKEAYQKLQPEMQEILQQAYTQIANYHEKQIRHDFMIHEQPGVILGQMVLPIERVGIYVPGGTAPLFSTVLMNAVPAKLAGVKELVLVSPPQKDTGEIAEMILAAAYVAKVDRVFRVGGAQAIAALAYGTKSVPQVQKIVGPGNIYVALAKKTVYGEVDIDMIAGPSEILVVADENANPAYLAADLLSQAEHDLRACSILITTSKEVAAATAVELEKQLKTLPRREIAETSIRNYGRIFYTDSMELAMEVANVIAPEHLELCTVQPFDLLGKVKNAGSVFLGAYAPEPLGDYWAGPNHTLPTSGTATFASPLSVDDFVKKTQVTYYTKEALQNAADRIAILARREGLEAHARAIDIRKEDAQHA